MSPTHTRPHLQCILAMAGALAIGGCDRGTTVVPLGDRVAVAAGPVERSGKSALAFDAVAGRSYLVRVEQSDVDVAIELRGPDRQTLRRMAAAGRNLGREYLLWTAARSEQLEVAVPATGWAAASARFAAEVIELRPDLEAPIRQTLEALGSPGAPEADAVTRLASAEAALPARASADLGVDVALRLAAERYWNRQDWRGALEAARRGAHALEGNLRDARLPELQLLEAAAILELVRSGHSGSGSGYPQAEALLARARQGFLALSRPVDAATVLLYRGTSRFYQGDYDGALAANAEARVELERLDARDPLLLALQNLAGMALTRGEYRGATEALERLLPLTAGGDTRTRLSVLQNSAIALQALGESEQSLERYLDALALARSLDDESSIARILNGVGIVHLQLGQPSLAELYLREAAETADALGDRGRKALALQSLGDAEARLGREGRAVATLREALRALGPDESPLRRARLAVALAKQLARAGASGEALTLYEQALSRQQDSRDRVFVDALVGRAALLRAAGRHVDAEAALARAAMLAEANGSPQGAVEVAEEQARLARAKGDPAEALRVARLAAARVESYLDLVRAPDNRVTLATRLRTIYDLQIDMLAETAQVAADRGDAALARAASAEALLSIERAGDRVALVPPLPAQPGAARNARAADERAQELYERLAGKRQRLEMLFDRHSVETPETRSLVSEIALLQTALATEIARNPAPRRQAPRRDDALAQLDRLQRRLASEDLLLVYRLGETRSWLWTVERQAVRLHALPARASIAREIATLLADVRRLAPREAIERRARTVRAALLPQEVWGMPSSRWLLMADGPTSAVPWPLVDPQRARSRVELVSLDAIGVGARPARPRRVALIADPVFAAADPRLPRPTPTDGLRPVAAPARASTSTPTATPVHVELARLPGGLAELEAIDALLKDSVVVRLTGADASREALLGITAGRADVLHVATHAKLDTDVPQLSALVLSRYDRAGRPVRGEIRAWEIARMSAAPGLVVLSACDAAANPSQAAPGLVNLARAFLSAGSSHVVASLWPVSDAGAVAFMSEFYRALIGEAVSPEAALQIAQSRLANSPRFGEPFFWSGFVVLGRAA